MISSEFLRQNDKHLVPLASVTKILHIKELKVGHYRVNRVYFILIASFINEVRSGKWKWNSAEVAIKYSTITEFELPPGITHEATTSID